MSVNSMFLIITACALTMANCSFIHGAEPQPTAYLTIISEKDNVLKQDYPHAAALLEYPDGKKKWIGFAPKTKGKPKDEGKIDDSRRDGAIDKYVRLGVDPKKLAAAEQKIRKKYSGLGYVVLVTDCVSLVADLCEEAGLKIPPRPNFIPGNLVDKLKELNPQAKPMTGDGKGPFPWAN